MYRFHTGIIPILSINWHSFLLGSEHWIFLLEVSLRSVVMFLIILFSLRILGKRSVSQLSVFELGVIIGLGSAAGDPMFYKDVGLLPGIVVFIIVITLYRIMTFVINSSEKVEHILEGKPVYLTENGKFNYSNFQKEPIAHEEFFAQLRQRNVSHLGQVKQALIETNGSISLFYFPNDEVKWGLPILPKLYNDKVKQLAGNTMYACSYCGLVEKTNNPQESHACPVCTKEEWVAAINSPRII